MAISKEEVQHVAHLARLEFSEEDLERFTRELSSILDYVAKLSEVDTSGVEPTYNALRLTNRFREDQTRSSFPPEEILANAPEREGTSFVVPRVIRS
ncbi:Asp-tRNA(Asn)/Glu-tRNA(Gln) amidotransferase subunit GatC [Thermosulfurimonas marina]|uniref:Aspartyl/glutamyl-tRNA(Asn/Gln) amidotransferase subunit C n=1 Tax=Thermosulfurimonas marina TaxID=2047767 RepID=A0A6H1WRR9_9BACT|nr:Asp-tRNA(Asn)/Glu-tRNA(Gln) amidotransferase subunit GatC [Thermosulfurimonas marina]QJA05860.1 Asp-tRNA(Asn)/Glu-tRNA(Gln) amidotransferase subunit GatC [Thermosulfurimonas marina]